MKLSTRVITAILSLAFVSAGIAKLTGQTAMLEAFNHFGMPIEFMYFIGASEVAGAIGLQLHRTTTYAALGLLLVMIGAIASHLVFDPVQKSVPALFLALLLTLALWLINKPNDDHKT